MNPENFQLAREIFEEACDAPEAERATLVQRRCKGNADVRLLVEGLLATEGCLGADAGQMMSGKNVIVAWFEDKAATVRWYESNTHKGIMEGMTSDIEGYSHTPLAHVDDEDTPIMVIATITPSTDGSTLAGFPAPISQVSIELFAPLPGGAYWNGRFAPPAFEVEHIKDLSE